VESIEVEGKTLMKFPSYDKNVEVGVLHHVKYPVSDGFLNVCTTRLETLLGDVALAVHPNDERYQVNYTI
jgi:valyl-tRNA synthetase